MNQARGGCRLRPPDDECPRTATTRLETTTPVPSVWCVHLAPLPRTNVFWRVRAKLTRKIYLFRSSTRSLSIYRLQKPLGRCPPNHIYGKVFLRLPLHNMSFPCSANVRMCAPRQKPRQQLKLRYASNVPNFVLPAVEARDHINWVLADVINCLQSPKYRRATHAPALPPLLPSWTLRVSTCEQKKTVLDPGTAYSPPPPC